MSDFSKMNQRDYWYDNAKALLIILVVVGHLTTTDVAPSREWVDNLAKFIYFFHMPVFMIVSGRFSRGRIERREYGKAICQILIPYLILETGIILIYSALNIKQSNFAYIYPMFGLWYLFVLFIYLVITPTFLKLRHPMILALLAVLLSLFLPSTLYGGFHRALTFYPFFLFGYFTSKMDFSFCKRWWFRLISVLFFAALLIGMLLWGNNLVFEIFNLRVAYGELEKNQLLVIGEYIIHYALSFVCFFTFLGITPSKKTFFSYIGAHSFYVYGLHLFFIITVRKLFEPVPLPDDVWVILYLFSGVLLAFLLASPPIRWLARPFIEPKVNFRRILETLPLDSSKKES